MISLYYCMLMHHRSLHIGKVSLLANGRLCLIIKGYTCESKIIDLHEKKARQTPRDSVGRLAV